jgi:hypothetical protein
MKTSLQLRFPTCRREQSLRGSVLITAMIFSIILAVGVVSYLSLSHNSLKLAQRTFLANTAANLAEAGLEEAVMSFNQLGYSTGATDVANAWPTATGWNRGTSVADVYMTDMGQNYSTATPPTVSFSGGGGTGAQGTAVVTTYYTYDSTGVSIEHTEVSGVTITHPGSGYTSAPTITLTGGGGTGASAKARLAATRTLTFNNLGQNTSGTVKVWAAGYDGSAVIPIVVAKAIVQPADGPPVQKMIKIVLSKNGILPKGVVAKNGINWNGHPAADSYISSTVPGIPPFTDYDHSPHRANTILASLNGTIDLSHGTVSGNVMLGPGVTVTGGTITGQVIGNFSANFNLDPTPTNSGATAGVDLGSSLPATLPRAVDAPAADGTYYYYVHGATIGGTSITSGKRVKIVGNGGTSVGPGFNVLSDVGSAGPPAVAPSCGNATLYIDGPVNLSGNGSINTTSWAGALTINTTTTHAITVSGNGKVCCVLNAPNAALTGNGGGNDAKDFCGSFVVGSITSNGHMSFHYDEGLGSYTNPRPWALSLWKELQTAQERAIYADKLNF